MWTGKGTLLLPFMILCDLIEEKERTMSNEVLLLIAFCMFFLHNKLIFSLPMNNNNNKRIQV